MMSNKEKSEEKAELDIELEKIRAALRTDNKDIIDEISSTGYGLLSKEKERTKDLDSKAANAFTMIGVSTSIMFTLGGILIEKIQNVDLPIIGCPIHILVLLYIISNMLLLISAGFTLDSLRARKEFWEIGGDDIFNSDMIKSGINEYKRYMISHVWIVRKKNSKINEKKATSLKRAQWIFMGALIPIFLMVFIIGMYVWHK